MGIHVAIEHRTRYVFDRAVQVHPHVLRLRPAPHCRTPILAYSLSVEPADHFVNWQQDPFGNYAARFVFPEPARELAFTVDLVADLTVINPFDFFVEESAERFPFTYDAGLALDLEPYRRVDADLGATFDAWVAGLAPAAAGEPVVDFLVGVNRRAHRDVAYSVRMEPGVQTPGETLTRAMGSCRDSAWLLVQALRHLGLAARFVSGYLVQLTADVAALDGPDGPAADFTDLHAWAEVYLPGAGWVGLDPTSGLFAGEGHIPLACTPRPESAAPVTGATGRCEVRLEFANVVHRVREDPRVTLPYTPEQWARIDEVGHRVDDLLGAGDVRLTMGGEPTFVSIDEMDGDEWNTAADGPHKRALALDLTERLARRWAPHGIVQHGQGKWYPGEPLPRWQIGVVWRTDGQPLWKDPSRLSDPWSKGAQDARAAHGVIAAVAERFGIDPVLVLPAYEDPLVTVAAEVRRPAGDPPGTDLTGSDGDDEASAFVAALDAAVTAPAGWVLPLHHRGTAWATTRWHLRRGRLVLLAGDSPVGLRLPLDSLSWSPHPPVYERPAFESRDALPPAASLPSAPALVVERHEAPPTALSVELRDGNVCVFLPPLEHAEHAVELVAVLEDVAHELDVPLVLEGYALPRDPRLATVVVTPDPGVIEVNVQPSASWPELRDLVLGLGEDARRARLGTEKFALDGLHTGTGGGNHITLGGPTPADSPVLRNPALLRSMLTFWQHHPSLSYLFSGRFIGPTSQAPRVDEARHEHLYELEIAFAELERHGDDVPPWLVDRLLRHLLVDLTGNTHRAEFCIDKLFSPDSERGRLGLVELRGFEMPPHPQMALVQALLIRSLVARLWRTPFRAPLVRWGTDLHDRFMLPWYVAEDIGAVVEDLNRHGVRFERDWLAPFLEFRFPLVGEVTVRDVHLELRTAIEPWHVLGEETTAGATARYVDSSVERLQLLAHGVDDARHVVTCNGIPVPLHPTSSAGVSVAGVRYKAWKPWSALHPTIDVHTPLVFDVVDRWSARSLGGCTYHVAHPGGRAYDTFPVNANEAEARRAARFFRTGHTPGSVDLERLAAAGAAARAEYPRTLDLRRHPAR